MNKTPFQSLSREKLFLSFLTILFFISCNTKKPIEEIGYTGFLPKKVLLIGILRDFDQADTIGELTINIPARLDTFYQWHRTSDCLSCGKFQYRFADRKYKQFAEGGFFWTYVPDSVYQLTISHVPTRDVPDSIHSKPLLAKDTFICEYLAHQLTPLNKITYLKKEFKEINGRGFVISGFITPYGEITNSNTLYLTATTRLRKRNLNFIAECGAKDTTGFFDNMYKSLLSIKIEEK
jgi:hypothetical protein